MPDTPCIHCGETIEAGDKFCEHCGKAQTRASVTPVTIATPPPVSPPTTTPAERPPAKNESGGNCGCILIVILTIGLLGGISFCNKQRQQKQKPPPRVNDDGLAIPIPYGADGTLKPPSPSPRKP